MLLTITPFIADGVANDWQKAVNCLQRTLGSILGNSERDLRAMVICQDRPQLEIKDDRYIFLQTKLPKPDKRDYLTRNSDKGRKIIEGFEVARQMSPEYVMIVDADDLISNNLISYVYQRPNFDAFCLKVGYEWREGTSFFTKRNYFNQYCGSSFIWRFNEKLFPAWLGKSSGERVSDQSHSHVEAAMDAKGFLVDKIREPKAVYVTGHGNNHGHSCTLKRKMKDLILSPWQNQRLTEELEIEFGLTGEMSRRSQTS